MDSLKGSICLLVQILNWFFYILTNILRLHLSPVMYLKCIVLVIPLYTSTMMVVSFARHGDDDKEEAVALKAVPVVLVA